MEDFIKFLMTYESDTFSATERTLDEREAAVIAWILIGHWLETLDGAQIEAALEQVRDEEMLALDAHKMKAFLLERGWIDCGGGGSYRCKLVKRMPEGQSDFELNLSLSLELADYAVVMASNLEHIMWLEKVPKHELMQMFGGSEFNWTTEQSGQAEKDGWDVFNSGSDDHPTYQLQRVDEMERFADDYAAWLYVVAQAQAGNQLCRQAMAFLHAHAPKEHRAVWVNSMKYWVQQALQAPNALLIWLQSQEPKKEIGWRPIECFLRSIGIRRSDVGVDWVDIFYFDESERIRIFNTAEAEQPAWLSAFMQELTAFSRHEKVETPNADTLFALVHRVVETKAEMTISAHLPTAIAEQTKYSVDGSLIYEALDGCDLKAIKIEAFNPSDPNICFRDGEHQELEFDDPTSPREVYIDVIWSLDAESPEAANRFVNENLAKVIPTPPGLKLKCVTVEAGVYDNAAGSWVEY